MSSIASAHSPTRTLDLRGTRALLLGFASTLLLALLIAVSAAFAIGLANEGRVLPGVRVGGVAVGGLDRDAAAKKLEAVLPALPDVTAIVSVNGTSLPVVLSDLGRAYDPQAMADAAYDAGRSDNPEQTVLVRLRDALGGTDLPVAVRWYDPARLDQLTASVVAANTSEPVDASVKRAAAGSFTVVPAKIGSRVDPVQARQTIANALQGADAAALRIEIPVTTSVPAITTEMADAAANTARAISSRPIRFTDGKDRFTLTPAQLAGLVAIGPGSSGGYEATLDSAAVRAAIATLAKRVDRSARDASYAWAARLEVIPSVTGRKLDQAATVTMLTAALQARAQGAGSAADIKLPVSVTQPKFTTASAQATVGNIVRIGTWTTYYFPGVSNGFGANITVPAQALDGKVIAPGANFDFWRDIGPVTVEAGYRYGGAIINGKSEPTGAFAGGICSASTTMFNAALRAGLQMGERWNHYYYISRYPVGLDATVFADAGRVWSMSFTNDTPYPIIIRSFTGYGIVTFSLYSVPNGRTVSFTTPIITNPIAAHDTVQYTTSLPAGVQQRVEGVYNGFDAQVTRYVRDASGNLIHTDTFYSHYHPVNGILLIGKPA
jgi:vancomycin resistance protein YoaR